MEVGTITAFLDFHKLNKSVQVIRGNVVMGVAPSDKAGKGDLAWSKDKVPDFRGAMLLNNKYAMALVVREFFLDKKRPIIVHPSVVPAEGAVIGKDGFGFVWSGSEYVRWPHVGGVVIEEDVEIGANTAVDRGSLGDTVIRRGAKLDNLIHVAHNCDIGEHTLIAAGAMISGSVTIGKRCFIGVGSTIAQKLTIGDGAVIGAGAVVVKDVPPGQCWIGNPARYYKEASDVPHP